MNLVATFASNGSGQGKAGGGKEILAALRADGLEVGDFQPVVRTGLDTFDGRLHAAGLRLELRRSTGSELILTGGGTVPVSVPVSQAPRFASDLPGGAFRARLAGVLDVRALQPRIVVSGRQAVAVTRDQSGKTVASVRLLRGPAVDGGADIALPGLLVEVEELAGYPKPAARLRRTLEGLGLARQPGDTLDAAMAAAGVDPAGFSGSPTVALDPQTATLDGYTAVLAHLAGAIDANWQGTVDDTDPEFLHDLRVAVRRTRSVLGQAKGVLPAPVLERYRAGFERLGSATGPARDLDVYVIEWNGYLAPMAPAAVAALGTVFDHLEKRRRAAHVALAKDLRTKATRTLLTSWRAWLGDPHSSRVAPDEPSGPGPAFDADQPLGAVVGNRITKAQQRLLRHGRAITPAAPAEDLHDLRKDAKKLRYLLECFGGLLPAAGRKAFVQQLKALQDNLGEHQDAEVHVTELRQISGELRGGKVDADTLLAMGQLIEHLEQRRLAARREFAERFAAYDSQRTHRALADVLARITP